MNAWIITFLGFDIAKTYTRAEADELLRRGWPDVAEVAPGEFMAGRGVLFACAGFGMAAT